MSNLKQILRENLNNQDIQNYLESKYPNNFIYMKDEPIKNSIHCSDIDVNGIEVRLRFYSPSHKGDKSVIGWYVVTDEQKAEKKSIEDKFNAEKERKRKKDLELQNWNWRRDRMFR